MVRVLEGKEGVFMQVSFRGGAYVAQVNSPRIAPRRTLRGS